ncbi:hypothetical protein C8R44DRAFT_640984 [Mycena epipterygia]|nr:hypothetical protein C8R44DRAFT_640984 [Mycena epipterygia]
MSQTPLCADISATLVCVQKAPRDQPIEILSRKKAVQVMMTERLQDMEDRGWIGVADRAPLRALAAELKARTGSTFFKLQDRDSTSHENEGIANASRLAKEALQATQSSTLCFDVEPSLDLKGVKLAKLTQALAYAGIKELKTAISRKASDNNIKQILSSLQQEFRRRYTAPEIWKSIRNKDFSRQVKNFLWKSVHSAHRIGNFWKHIPECEERGICQFCDEPEDLEHIILKCKRPGQSLVWSLVKELWLRKHSVWPELSLGTILGCGLATFTDEKKRPLPATARLYRILVSESLFIIWKLRNESVISKGGEPLPENLIHNKWLNAINLRLKFDCALTNQAKYGKQNSIRPSLVLQTWSSTLMNEEKLPDNWLKEPRVLVGTEPKSSHPPSQPSGRRGRGR